jgi:electron transfer flavoprotein beta subunit
VSYLSVTLPRQQRETKIIKDLSPDQVAQEIAAWLTKE